MVFCHVHTSIHRENVEEAKKLHPNAPVLTHPECTADVLEISDFIGSTSEILDYATKSDAKEFIICTEMGIFFELEQKNPDKRFLFCRTSPVLSKYEENHIRESGSCNGRDGTGSDYG